MAKPDKNKDVLRLSRDEALWHTGIRVTVTDMKQILKDTYANELCRKWTIDLIGESGIGKSWIIEQVAKELEIGFLRLVGTGLESVDVRGFPMPVRKLHSNGYQKDDVAKVMADYYSTEPVYKFQLLETLQKAFSPDWSGILLLDEFAQASKEVQDVFFQIIYDRRMDEKVLSPGVMVVTAMNPPNLNEYMLSKISKAALDRLEMYIIDPSATEWVKWARSYGIDGRVVEFITEHPNVYDKNKGRRLHNLADKMSMYQNLETKVVGEEVVDDETGEKAIKQQIVIPHHVKAQIYATVDPESADMFVKFLREVFEVSGIQILLGDKDAYKKLKRMMKREDKTVFMYRVQQEMVKGLEEPEVYLKDIIKKKNDKAAWGAVAENLIEYMKLLKDNDMDSAISLLKSITKIGNGIIEEEIDKALKKSENLAMYKEVVRCMATPTDDKNLKTMNAV